MGNTHSEGYCWRRSFKDQQVDFFGDLATYSYETKCTECTVLLGMPVADPGGGTIPARAALRDQIFKKFHEVFWENLPNLYIGAPSYEESWIRPCMQFIFVGS